MTLGPRHVGHLEATGGPGVGRARTPVPEDPSWPGHSLACLLKCRRGRREGLEHAAGRLSCAIEPRAVRQPSALPRGPQAEV